MKKEFPLADVLGVLTGKLLGKIDGIYEVCQFMTGEPVWTHQLPRVCREITPGVLRQHPRLEPTIAEAGEVTPENVHALLSGWIARFGPALALEPMAPEEHERIDPVSELAEKVRPDKIMVVKL